MSLRKAINAMCKECIYDPGSDGTWKRQVAECVSRECPLFNVRPGRARGLLKGLGLDTVHGRAEQIASNPAPNNGHFGPLMEA